MNAAELVRAVNVRETLKLYFAAIGRYPDFMRSYGRDREGGWTRPDLHASTSAQHEPLAMRICGDRWGDNPNLPDHPMRVFFNQNFRKEQQ